MGFKNIKFTKTKDIVANNFIENSSFSFATDNAGDSVCNASEFIENDNISINQSTGKVSSRELRETLLPPVVSIDYANSEIQLDNLNDEECEIYFQYPDRDEWFSAWTPLVDGFSSVCMDPFSGWGNRSPGIYKYQLIGTYSGVESSITYIEFTDEIYNIPS